MLWGKRTLNFWNSVERSWGKVLANFKTSNFLLILWWWYIEALINKWILFFRVLEELYEAHGDTLAVQYGGSQMVHRWTTSCLFYAYFSLHLNYSKKAQSLQESQTQHDKSLIFIRATFLEKLVSHHQAVIINCWIPLSLSRLLLTLY